jgi:uncharacterized iron-regulated membrane protein
MKNVRTVIFWCHLVTGVLAGIVVFVMSATGVLLTYERQIAAWADTRAYTIAPSPSQPRLSVEALVAKVREAKPESPSSVTLVADPTAPAAIGYGRGRTVYVDPYSGSVLGEGAVGVRDFFRVVEDVHRWLGAEGANRDVARAITGACNLGFLFLVMSGFYIWWPRKWTKPQLRNVTWFRRGLSSKARDFNWHNVIGFWSFIPLFVVVLSGVVMSYGWANNLVYRVAGEQPPPPRTGPPGGPGGPGGGAAPEVSTSGIDPLWARAESHVQGWKTISLQLPTAADTPLSFSIDSGTGGQPQARGQLTLDRATGEVVKWEPFSTLSAGRRLRTILRFAHTGEVLGIAGQTLAGIVSLGATVLVWTGLSLSLRRFRAWRARRVAPAPAGSVAEEG